MCTHPHTPRLWPSSSFRHGGLENPCTDLLLHGPEWVARLGDEAVISRDVTGHDDLHKPRDFLRNQDDKHAYEHTYMNIYTCLYMHGYIHTCTCMHTFIHTYIHVHAQLRAGFNCVTKESNSSIIMCITFSRIVSV